VFWLPAISTRGVRSRSRGPYRFTRPPLYLGSAIVALGVAVGSASIYVAAIIAVYIALVVGSTVRHEEQNMRMRFGNEYDR